MKHHVKRYYFT